MNKNQWEEEYFSYSPKIFREINVVKFWDITIDESKNQDLVIHDGPAISPPNSKIGTKQFYLHHYQIDYNRVIFGARTFEVINFDWEYPYHIVYMGQDTPALKIPTGTFHRSTSEFGGSVVINHSVRIDGFDIDKEFIPANSSDNNRLRQILENVSPVEHGNPCWRY